MVEKVVRSWPHNRIVVGGVAILLCAANFSVAWPGTLTIDSQSQLSQAISGQFSDWHPPFMAMLWRFIGPTLSTMLFLQIVLHWLGIWAFAEGVRRIRPSGWIWVILAIGLTPIALKYTQVIQKDSLMTSFFLLAFGLAFLTSRRMLALPFGIAGILCRSNGVFALPPLLIGNNNRQFGFLVSFVASLVIAAFLGLLIGIFNTHVLASRETGVQRSLQLFDLAGIAHFSRDNSSLPAGAKDAARCYTPVFRDTLNGCMAPMSSIKPSLTKEWGTTIFLHPLAYAQHRIAHFNRTIFFIVPPMQQCVDAPSYHRCDFSQRGKLRDFIQKNALLWPVTWLAIGVMLLAGNLNPTSRSLILSGSLYGAAYIVVGVAADFRYFYWTELAIQIAMLLQMALVGRIDNWKILTAGVGIVWTIGYGARILLA